MMTTLLSRTRDGPSVRAALHADSQRDRATLQELQGDERVSTLLTTGDSEDEKARTVTAVTGYFTPSPVGKGVVLEAAIVSRNTSPGATYGAIPYDLEPITPGNNEAAIDLLQKWADTRYREFEEHLRDVVTIVQYIARTRPSDTAVRTAHKIAAFATLIHSRAVYKLRARLDAGSSCWGVSPITIIVDEVREGLRKGTYAPRKSEIVLSPSDATYVTAAGIPPSSTEEGSRYALDPTTIEPWLRLLKRTYEIIDTKANPLDTKANPQAIASDTFQADVKEFVAEMPLFQILVRDLVPALISVPLGSILRSRYIAQRTMAAKKVEKDLNFHYDKIAKGTQKAPTNPPEEDVLGEDPIEDAYLDGNDPAEDPGDEDAIHPENDEDGGSLVVRYLKTLCAWYDAATRIFGHIPKEVSLRVAHVRVNAVKSDITQSTIGDFVTRYLETLTNPEHRARALAFFCFVGLTKLVKQGNAVKGPSDLPPFRPASETTVQNFAKKATVHAEAALMGLMCLKRSGETAYDAEGFENILKAKPTVIGVSKKCCRTCWILSQLLAEDDAEAHPSGKASLYLSGTHAMIYPWAPPDGIPLPILLQLRERLFSIFVRITCTHNTGLGSNQSSPTLSQGPEPEVMLTRDQWAFETTIRTL